LYGEAQGGVTAVCAELGLPLRQFAWRAEMRHAGLRRAAIYLVRPDGYIALADPDAVPGRLREYFVTRR
jgi:hypothetical protein